MPEMNKSEKIKFYKKQIETCRDMKAVAEQNMIIATRLESEAKSALELLGANPEHSRKRKYDGVLSEEQKLKLTANLIK